MGLVSTMCESSAVLQRATIARDANQGVTQDPFVTKASNLPCSQQEEHTTIIDLYGQRNTQVDTSLYFPADPACEVNDRFTVTDRTGQVTYYLVEGEAQIAAGRGQLWKVQVKRVRKPK